MKIPIIALCILCPGLSHATGIAFDFFSTDSGSYTSGASILGQGPSTSGFSGSWSGFGTVNTSSSGLTAVPNAYAATGGSATQSGGVNVTRSFDSAGISLMSTTTDVWYSFHMQTNHQNGTNTLRLVNSSDSDLILSFGQRVNGIQAKVHAAPGYTWPAVQLNDGGSTTDDEAFTLGASGTGLWLANTTVLMVVNLTIDRAGTNPEVIKFWKLSNASSFDPLTPFFTITKDILDSTYTGFTGVAIEGNFGSNIYDEIRVGTASIDVIPIPEPSAFLLIVAGAVLTVRRRNRSLREIRIGSN